MNKISFIIEIKYLINVPKRLNKDHQFVILRDFDSLLPISEISKKVGFTELTIQKFLKKELGISEFNKKKELSKTNFGNKIQDTSKQINKDNSKYAYSEKESFLLRSSEQFFEIEPVLNQANFDEQKDLSSTPIDSVNFSDMLYMIIDEKSELEVKLLRDFPEWSFLSDKELLRGTIEIFNDMKSAKNKCLKKQKVIKVPNPNVFKKVVPILLSRGISRIINAKNLIALN